MVLSLVSGRALPQSVLGKRPGSLGIPLADCTEGPARGLSFPWPGPGVEPAHLSDVSMLSSCLAHRGRPSHIPSREGLSSNTWEASRSSQNQARLTTAGGGTTDWTQGHSPRRRDRRHFSPADTMLGSDVLGQMGVWGWGICAYMGRVSVDRSVGSHPAGGLLSHRLVWQQGRGAEPGKSLEGPMHQAGCPGESACRFPGRALPATLIDSSRKG